MMPRGSEASISRFGATYDDASRDQLLQRARWGFRGKGKYSVSKFIRDAGALGEGIKKSYNAWVPKSLRDQAIGIVSSKLGSFAGSGLYTGRGGYEANELVAGGMPSMGVIGSNDETEAICISNREYVTDVYGAPSSKFYNQSLMLNPGQQQNFPWLSQIAANYEEYEFRKLLFMYKSTIDVGNANTSGQTGTLIMCCNYNPSAPSFETKDTMMQYHGAVSGKATDDMVCGIECDPAKTKSLATFIRVNGVPSGEDPKTYDYGRFQFALNNIPLSMINIQLGELWVEYEVVLRKPKLGTQRAITLQTDYFMSSADTTAAAAAPSRPLGSAAYLLKARNNSIGCSVDLSLSGVAKITFPASFSGLVEVKYTAAAVAATTAASGTIGTAHAGNVSLVYDMPGGNDSWLPEPGVQSSWSTQHESWTMIVHYRVSPATGGVDNYITISTSGITLTGTTRFHHAVLQISEYNPSFARSSTDPSILWTNYNTGTDIAVLPTL